MQRRQFIGLAAGALAGGLLSGHSIRAIAGVHSAIPDASGPLNAAQYHASRRFAKTRFGEIAYVERGAGKVALFLHAHPYNGFQWRGALDRLSAHRRCIAPDLLALGYTRVAAGQSVTPAAQAAMLVALLDKLAIRDVDLVANDSGAAIAQLIIARHPRRVRSVLFTNGDEAHDSPPPALKPLIALAHAGKSTDVFDGWLADKASARLPNAIGGAVYANPATLTDEAIDYYFTPLIRSSRQRALVDASIIGFEPNPLAGIAPALKRFKGPVRIVWGAADTLFSPDSPDRLDRAFGNSRGVRRLEGMKTFWPEELPDVLAEEARQLWGVA